MKKKVMLLSIALMLVFAGVVSAASIWGQYKGFDIIRITVDGAPVKTDVPAFVFNNRTMVPVYLLKEAGISYSADGKNQTVDIKKPKTTTATTSFDPTAATKEIMALGGVGVTIMNIEGDTTAMVHFHQQISYEKDWPKIVKIFAKLVPFNATFSRVEYYVNGVSEGVIEIRTKNYKDYINGVITSAELDKHWLLFGNMFSSSSNNGSSGGSGTTISSSYPELYSNDLKTYLGKMTTNEFDSDSIFNDYGTYGSKYNSKSIWNEYGTYGSSYSSESAFNKYATKPPAIVLDGEVVGYLTINTTITGAVSPIGLQEWLEDLGY